MPSCPICGGAVPEDAPLGQCPACLFAGGAAVLSGGPQSLREVPDAGEIAAAFPELEILHLLGRGGMGAVYLARQPQLDRHVALKVLPPAVADAEFEERFRREATVMARLNHPNVVTLHEFGERGGMFYLIMEFVDGEPLSERIRRGAVTPGEALRLVPQICEALDYSHRAGVVHRDIKPANLLVGRNGRVKIADFGVARLALREPDDWTLTGTRTSVGTPRYMAPEQMEATGAADHRADLYSLGVVFYELLTGKVPAGHFDPPSELRQDVSPGLDAVVMRAMHADPAARYQHASEIREDVEAVRAGRRPRHAAPRPALLPVLVAAVAAAGLSTAAVWYFLRDPGKQPSGGPSAGAPNAPDGRLVVFGEAPPGLPEVSAIALAMGGWERPCGFAVLAGGQIRAWGDNSYGQTNVPARARPALAVAAPAGARGRHALALLADGTVAGWGDNSFGGQATPPTGLTGVKAIAAGDYFSLALTKNGTVRGWGEIELPPALPAVRRMTAAARSAVFLMEDGSLGVAGSEFGLANGVPADGPFSAIAAGEAHALALTADGSGTVRAWGDNREGQCDVPPGLEAERIFAGQNTSVALTNDGKLVAWGALTRTDAAPAGMISAVVCDRGILALATPEKE
jgi:hypothetical protein